jgi:AcrR family transcriptional regulator
MAERKRPRRTRERILETSLALFNRSGAPQVTTADIADELNISPGNLYYHFRNKDEIIGELLAACEARLAPLLVEPGARRIGVEDLWLWLHVLFERMGEYRFLYRDIDMLAGHDRRFGARFGDLLRRFVATVAGVCRSMANAGTMHASEREIAALAQNVVLVATYWPSFDHVQRVEHADRGQGDESAGMDAGRAAYQVLSLFAPYLVAEARTQLEGLAADYL